jgi:hypothetical protein
MSLNNTRQHTTPSHELAIVVGPRKFFALKGNWVSILHEHPTNGNIAYINVDFKWFGEVQEY